MPGLPQTIKAESPGVAQCGLRSAWGAHSEAEGTVGLLCATYSCELGQAA